MEHIRVAKLMMANRTHLTIGLLQGRSKHVYISERRRLVNGCHKQRLHFHSFHDRSYGFAGILVGSEQAVASNLVGLGFRPVDIRFCVFYCSTLRSRAASLRDTQAMVTCHKDDGSGSNFKTSALASSSTHSRIAIALGSSADADGEST